MKATFKYDPHEYNGIFQYLELKHDLQYTK